MASIHRLHADGFFVLGDKPWLIDPGQIGMLKDAATTPPLAMDIMTERHEVATRLQLALATQPRVFGRLRDDGGRPAISIESVHHLYKIVNGAPLVRPSWVFDVAIQGEGITDVTTHLVDLAQWFAGDGRAPSTATATSNCCPRGNGPPGCRAACSSALPASMIFRRRSRSCHRRGALLSLQCGDQLPVARPYGCHRVPVGARGSRSAAGTRTTPWCAERPRI